MKKPENEELYKNKNGSLKPFPEELYRGFKCKVKFPLWVYPETLDDVERLFVGDNCSSKSEFVEKAIRFYVSYLNTDCCTNFLAPQITSVMNATVVNTEQRLARQLFRIAVELGKLTHLMAAITSVDDKTLSDLQGLCVNEVKRINGIIDTKDAVKFQHED